MNPKSSVFAAALALTLLSSQTGLTQQTPARANPENCPFEGFQGGFTRGCPQRQYANPSDISGLMAALPDKPYAAPKSLASFIGIFAKKNSRENQTLSSRGEKAWNWLCDAYQEV